MITPVTTLQPSGLFPRPDRLFRWVFRRQGRADLSRTDLNLILNAYRITSHHPIQRLSNPGTSANWVITTPAGKKMLKRYKPSLTQKAILREHAILQTLAQENFPAPRLNILPSGGTLIQCSGGYYALFDYLEGFFQYHHYYFPPGQAREFISEASRTLSVLHHVLQKCVPHGEAFEDLQKQHSERVHDFQRYRIKAGVCRSKLGGSGTRYLASGKWILGNQVAWIEDQLNRLNEAVQFDQLPRSFIHGDFTPYNLLLKKGSPVVVLDYEMARIDWLNTELAKALTYFTVSKRGINLDHAVVFLETYLSSRSLPPQQIQALPEVWLFLTLQRSLDSWYQYCLSGKRTLRSAAFRKLTLAHAIHRREGELKTRLTSINISN